MDANTHRFAQLLSRLFDRKGSNAGMTVVDDVMPTVDILSRPLETWCGRGEIPFGFSVYATPVAGQRPRLVIDPPPGMLMRVDRIAVAVSAAGASFGVGCCAGIAPLGNLVSSVAMDSRCVGPGPVTAGVVVASWDTNAGYIVTPWAANATVHVMCPAANTFYDVPMNGLVLSGADTACYTVECDTVNVTARISVCGMLRPDATAGELA